MLALRDEHIRVLQDEQQVFDLGQHYLQASSQKLLPAPGGAGGGTPSGPLMLTGGPGGALVAGSAAGVLTTHEIKAVKTMPAELIINRWKDTVRELGNILVAVEGSPDRNSHAYQEAMEVRRSRAGPGRWEGGPRGGQRSAFSLRWPQREDCRCVQRR